MKKILLSLAAVVTLSSSAFAAGTGGQAGSPISSILMLVVFFGIFWFLLIRPQQKKNKQLRKMLSEISKGDEVITNGGIVGKVAKLETNFVSLEIAENVVVKIQRNAVSNILPKGSINS